MREKAVKFTVFRDFKLNINNIIILLQVLTIYLLFIDIDIRICDSLLFNLFETCLNTRFKFKHIEK